jgi:DNA-binding SARP family transcriptional activator
VLSKKKEERWAVIQSKILPQLLQAAMIAKEDTYPRWLSVLINELTELIEMDCADNSADGVNENPEDMNT